MRGGRGGTDFCSTRGISEVHITAYTDGPPALKLLQSKKRRYRVPTGSIESDELNSRHVRYEACIVSFIDVLGFRTLIDTRSAAEVHRVVTRLERFTRPDEETPPRSMDEVRLNSRAFAYSVSDAIVRVRPYDTQYHDGAFFWELYDLLRAQIALVGSGVLIRAGVTVGDAYVGLTGKGPIFGPAVVRAFEIESQAAIFPRVVIDEYAIEQHRTDPRLRAEDNPLEYELEVVGKFLKTGEDGTRFIDYLRAGRGEFKELSSYLAFLERHAGLIREGRAQVSDTRISRKYEWLAHYHDGCVFEILEAATSDDLGDTLYEEGLIVDTSSYIRRLLVLDSQR